MNAASSERLVVFVTPAQKRVLAARAERMGISLSELVRRAVLAFDDTGQEVRAAGLIDRLGAASEASRNDPLRRLAHAASHEQEHEPHGHSAPTEAARGTFADAEPASACGSANADDADGAEGVGGSAAVPVAAAVARALVAQEAAEPEDTPDPEMQALVSRLLDSESTGSV
jgi:hypothetical protein